MYFKQLKKWLIKKNVVRVLLIELQNKKEKKQNIVLIKHNFN